MLPSPIIGTNSRKDEAELTQMRKKVVGNQRKVDFIGFLGFGSL